MMCDMMPMIDEESSDELCSSNSEDDTLDILHNNAKQLAKEKNLPPITNKLHRCNSDLNRNNPSILPSDLAAASETGQPPPETGQQNDDKLSLEDEEVKIENSEVADTEPVLNSTGNDIEPDQDRDPDADSRENHDREDLNFLANNGDPNSQILQNTNQNFMYENNRNLTFLPSKSDINPCKKTM